MTTQATATDAPAYRLRDIPRAAWLHVMYTDSHGEFHAELWACSFTEAKQRLADIGATRWKIGR